MVGSDILLAASALLTHQPGASAATAPPQDEQVDATIVVTATRTPVRSEDAPATVTVIDAERIADELATDIRDLVRYEPGVTVRRPPARFGAALGSTGRGGNEGFTIRGIGGNRVLIQVDGIRVPDEFGFGAQLAGRGDYIDLGLVKRVEILRGPASALYGSDGLAGVVSFTLSDPEDFLRAGRDAAALGRASYSSADQEFAETAILAGSSGPWSAMAAYTRRDFEELDNEGTNDVAGPLRTTPNPQEGHSNAALARIVWAPGGGHRVRLTGEYLDSFLFTDVLSGVGPTGFGPARVDALTARDTGERVRVSLDWSWSGAGIIDDARAGLYWQDAEDRQFTVEQRSPVADRERLNTFENRVYGASAELRGRFTTGPLRHRIVAGGDISVTRQEGLRDGIVPPPGETFPTRAFPPTDYMLAGLLVGDEIEIGGGAVTLYRTAARVAIETPESGAASPPQCWGLEAFEHPDRPAPLARPLWTRDACAGVLPVVAAGTEALADAFDLERLDALATMVWSQPGTEHLLLSDGLRVIRVDVLAGSLAAGPVQLRYLLAGIASAEPPLLTLQRLLRLYRARRFSRSLHRPEARARRWVLMLRTRDALAAGADQREIAAALLGPAATGPASRG